MAQDAGDGGRYPHIMIRSGSPFVLALALIPWRSARAQEAWPPSLPDLRRPAASVPAPTGAVALQPGVLDQLLPKIAEKNYGGLGDEAKRADGWQRAHQDVGLRETRGGSELSDGRGAVFPLSAPLAAALRHADQYFGMTPATEAHPPTHGELVAAATSAAGVESIAVIFERTIRDRLVTPTGVVVTEAGGEAALDGVLRFHEIPDMTRDLLPLVARAADDVDELGRLYARYPAAMTAVDDNGLLQNLLKRWPGWIARGLAKEKRDAVLHQTVDTLLRNTSDSYIFDPDTQFAAITSQEWSGRYVGRWHTHPPAFRAGGWGAADIPSGPDMDIASKDGQNMVFVFDPDGFDFYDLAPLAGGAPDLEKALKTSYRSPSWRARFQALYDQSFPKP